MALDIHKERGTPLDMQGFALHELCGPPHSKLDDDVFSRLRILRLLATEQGAARTSHALAANDRALQGTLARLRRLEAEQAAFLASLLPADLSPLETSIAVEQLEIETGAAIAHAEPNAYLAQTQRFAMVEDVVENRPADDPRGDVGGAAVATGLRLQLAAVGVEKHDASAVGLDPLEDELEDPPEELVDVERVADGERRPVHHLEVAAGPGQPAVVGVAVGSA